MGRIGTDGLKVKHREPFGGGPQTLIRPDRDAAKDSALLNVAVVLDIQEMPEVLLAVRENKQRIRMLLQEA